MAEPIQIRKLPVLKNAFGVDYEVPAAENYYGSRDFTMNPLSSITADNVLDEKILKAQYNTVMGTGQGSNVDTIALSPDVYLPPPPPPTVDQTVANKVNTALTAGGTNGTNIGNADRKAAAAQTLMGGDMGSFVSNLLRMFAQPEFQQAGFAGQGFGPTVLGATKALRAMETQDAEMMKAQMEALASAKAAGPGFELKGPAIELVDRISGANQALEAIQRMKAVLSAARVSGGGPAALQALKNFGNFFGVQLDATKPEEYKMEVNKLKQAILSSGLFGREATKAEYKILEQIVASPGLFTGDPELLAKLQGLEKSFNAKIAPAERMLRAGGVDTDNLFAPNPALATRN